MLRLDQVRDIADAVLRSTLDSSGYDNLEVTTGLDHDGEPSLFLAASFRPTGRIKDADTALDARAAVWNALRAHDDDRFPYISFIYPDDEFPDDAGLSEAAE